MSLEVKENHDCPLCMRPNACAIAETGAINADCWCRKISITEKVLDQIPIDQRNQFCICEQCATGKNCIR